MTQPTGDLAAIAKRRELAWNRADAWRSLTDDAYAYAIPNRRPARGKGGGNAGRAPGQETTSEIFDATAADLVHQSAAQLRDDIAPPGSALGRLSLTPLARRQLLKARGAAAVDALMEIHADLSDAANAQFTGASGFPTALLEVCLDAHVGTGAMLVLEGDIHQPCHFAAIPQDEIALEIDLFGRETLIDWKQMATKSMIRAAFPNAKFSEDFLKDWEKTSEDEIEFSQCWLKLTKGTGWRFLVFIENKAVAGKPEPALDQVVYACPVITMLFSRVPGEDRGRGPVLNLAPFFRVANKIMELQLKSAAIDLLGIWLYNPHDVNPDTLSLEPGAMWPGTTGGMMGESIKRLDTRGDRSDIAANLMGDLRQQIAAGFQRAPLPETGKTPGSATEYMVRDKENIRRYRGAYGRMVEDFVPRLFLRVVEIVQRVWNIHPNIKLDRMMTQLDVLSPLAVSMRMQAYLPVLEYMQVAGQIMALPPEVDMFAERERLLASMAYDTGARPEFIVNDDERAAKRQAQAAAMAMAAAAQAQAAQPQVPPPDPGTAT